MLWFCIFNIVRMSGESGIKKKPYAAYAYKQKPQLLAVIVSNSGEFLKYCFVLNKITDNKNQMLTK